VILPALSRSPSP